MAAITTYTPKGSLKKLVGSIAHLNGLGTGIALQRVYQTFIINLGDNFYTSHPYTTEQPKEHLPVIWINGKHEQPIALENKGRMSMYVIGVLPGLLPFFSRAPVAATNDLALGAEHWAEPDIFTLRERLLTCATIQMGFQLIEDYLTARLEGVDLSPLPMISFINNALPVSTVEQLCRELGYTRKKLRATAIHHFGAPIKNMQGIIRFQQHLETIARQPNESLSSLHSFFDQAHFINDFKTRTGISPGQYRRLCQQYPAIRHTPNFIPLEKETFLQFIAKAGA